MALDYHDRHAHGHSRSYRPRFNTHSAAPTGTAVLKLALGIVLAALIGVAIQRGGICAVKGVRLLMRERRPGYFLGFAEAAAWALAVLMLAQALGADALAARGGHATTLVGLAGGLLFGVGATINRGCAFGTVAWIGRGYLHFLAMIPGFVIGAAALEGAGIEWTPQALPPPAPVTRQPLLTIAAALLAAFAAWRLTTLFRWLRQGRVTARSMVRSDWPAPLAMAAIGLVNGVMLLTLADWPYTQLLVDAVEGDAGQLGARAAVALALIGGAVAAGVVCGDYRRHTVALPAVVRSLLGGALMGAGSQLVPGGNDALVLRSMPLLWPQAWLSYLALLAGIALTLHAFRRASRRPN